MNIANFKRLFVSFSQLATVFIFLLTASCKPPSDNTSVETNSSTPQLGKAWKNSLGMKFVPVPGTRVLFSIWETRVKDYRVFAKANKQIATYWQERARQEDYPVTQIPWGPGANDNDPDDAKNFCEWLTIKEQHEGRISKTQRYRLPRESEWDLAVGCFKYPWGDTWPPPNESGNYFKELHVDKFESYSPVGSFSPNIYGIYDLGGNVAELCEDKYDEKKGMGDFVYGNRVCRGSTYLDGTPDSLVSSVRRMAGFHLWGQHIGFRVVLEVDDSSK